MKNLVKNIIKEKKACLFVSPHLDDAAFSAGGLISYLSNKTKVVVITAFTNSGKDKHSLSAISYAKQCGYDKSKMQEFFKKRRKEDRDLFRKYGVEVRHLGFLDALWRPKEKMNVVDRFLSTFLDDFRYIYPTHRWHISKGKISQEDKDNLEELENRLKEIIGNEVKAQVFCPIGLGNHVDHIMVREVCISLFDNTIYWEDSPYNLYHDLEGDFIKKNELKRVVFQKNQKERKSMYPAYKTQFGKLFSGEKAFNIPPETYFLKRRRG